MRISQALNIIHLRFSWLKYLALSSEKYAVVDNEKPYGKVTIEMEMTMAMKMKLWFQWKLIYQSDKMKKWDQKAGSCNSGICILEEVLDQGLSPLV